MPLIENKIITSDESRIISYGTFLILSSKIHAKYDAREVLTELDKVVLLSGEQVHDYLSKKYPNEDKVNLRRMIRDEGIEPNVLVQIRAVELLDLGQVKTDD